MTHYKTHASIHSSLSAAFVGMFLGRQWRFRVVGPQTMHGQARVPSSGLASAGLERIVTITITNNFHIYRVTGLVIPFRIRDGITISSSADVIGNVVTMAPSQVHNTQKLKPRLMVSNVETVDEIVSRSPSGIGWSKAISLHGLPLCYFRSTVMALVRMRGHMYLA